jgi:hypothetical protein
VRRGPGARRPQDLHRRTGERADDAASLVERLAERVDVAPGDRATLLGP